MALSLSFLGLVRVSSRPGVESGLPRLFVWELLSTGREIAIIPSLEGGVVNSPYRETISP